MSTNKNGPFDPRQFLLHEPLYTSHACDAGVRHRLESYEESIDCFCLACDDSSVFNPAQTTAGDRGSQEQYFEVRFVCAREPEHEASFVFFCNGLTIVQLRVSILERSDSARVLR